MKINFVDLRYHAHFNREKLKKSILKGIKIFIFNHKIDEIEKKNTVILEKRNHIVQLLMHLYVSYKLNNYMVKG